MGASLMFSIIDINAFLCAYAPMRTTIDLPDELFREAKTRAVQQGTTLKNLMTHYIRSGLGAPGACPPPTRRSPPPVAIHRNPGEARSPALTNRQLSAILEEEDIRASRKAESQSRIRK